MKFVCDKCSTRYSIADERVKGRVLKIRCKACDHVITVREEHHEPEPPLDDGGEHTVVSAGPHPLPGLQPAPSNDLASAFESASSPPSEEWYVSFDGDQEGPFPLAKAIERVQKERGKGKEAHCWQPGFFMWLPVDEVPEFAPALQPGKKAPPSPVAADAPSPQTAKKGGTGTGKAPKPRRDPTGSSKPKKDVTSSGPKPQVAKDPTGPRAALAVGAPVPAAAPVAQPVHSIDSKPMPLPPPPEPLAPSSLGAPLSLSGPASGPALGALDGPSAPIPAGPLSSTQTRPEPRNAYKKPVPASGPTPALGAKALGEAPAKKPAFPDLGETGKKPLPEAKKPAEPKSTGARPAMAEPKSTGARPALPSAASLDGGGLQLAAHADKNVPGLDGAKPLDTGPTPLPPPPGDELPIGEASGLFNVAHLAAMSAQARSSARPAVETFGGQTVTPAQNGPSSSTPVVVVAGPAPRSTGLKAAALGGIALSVLLAAALVYVLLRPQPQPGPAPAPAVEANHGQRVDDQPIAMAVDPVAPGAAPGSAIDPKKAPTQQGRHVAAAHPKDPPAKIITGPQAKSGAPAPVGDDDDSPGGHALRLPSRGPSRSGGEVSQPAIAQVVTQNQRSLSLCYERVLKRDNSLKRAKVTTKVKIGISGSVKSVSIADPEYSHSEIGTCLVQTMKQWHFPPNSEEYETEIPLLLQAN